HRNQNQLRSNDAIKSLDLIPQYKHRHQRNQSERWNPAPVLASGSQQQNSRKEKRQGNGFLLGLPRQPTGNSSQAKEYKPHCAAIGIQPFEKKINGPEVKRSEQNGRPAGDIA